MRRDKWTQWFGAAAVVAAVLAGAPGSVWGQGAKPDSAALKEAKRLHGDAVRLYGEGKYDAAIPLAQRVLAIVEKALGPDHPDVAALLDNLAGLYHQKGDYARAEPLYQRALGNREKALGKEPARDSPDPKAAG
jgi:tetratricopeptide (TPR) repeat protein